MPKVGLYRLLVTGKLKSFDHLRDKQRISNKTNVNHNKINEMRKTFKIVKMQDLKDFW